MGKRETKESYKDSKDYQQDVTDRYDDLLGQNQPSSGESGSEGGGEGGIPGVGGPAGSYGGNYSSPFFGQTGGDYGDITGAPWTRGSGLEGRSSDISQIRGLWGGPTNPGEGSTTPKDQRDYLNTGYKGIYENQDTLKNPDKISSAEQQETLGQFKKFRDTGGLSDETVNRMRGMGGFDEFAKTGGYTPEAIANIKAQALSPIGAYAGGTRDELSRRAAVQGGYTPGFDAASRQLQRDAARNIAATSLDANVGIQDRINQGRQWGIGNVASAEGGIAGMQSANRMNALQGESAIGANLSNISAEDIANSQNTDLFNIQNKQNMKLAGLGGLGGLYEGTMGRGENAFDREMAVQQNALNRGLTSSENAYNRYHTTDENAVDRDFNARESSLGREFAGGQNALDRNLSTSQANANRQLAIMNSMFGQRGQGLSQQAQLGMQPGIGGNIMAGIGAGAGILGGMMGGGMFGGGRGLTNTPSGQGTAAFDPYRGYW